MSSKKNLEYEVRGNPLVRLASASLRRRKRRHAPQAFLDTIKMSKRYAPRIPKQSQGLRGRTVKELHFTVKELHSLEFPFKESERVQGFALR